MMELPATHLPRISEKSVMVNYDDQSMEANKYNKPVQLRPTNSYAPTENGSILTVSSLHSNTSKNNNTLILKTSVRSVPSNRSHSHGGGDETGEFHHYESTSVVGEEQNRQREKRLIAPKFSISINEHDTIMESSVVTSGDNDVIEIHQFSSSDVDAYLDIYFETLSYRLKCYVGEDEVVQQFRVAMKNRINANRNSSEYQNVLLGKINGEILAAVKILFAKEAPTIPQTSDTQPRSSCLTPFYRWMVRKADYVPTNADECYIEMIGVKNAYRNHGIGSAMLESAEQFARRAGAKTLSVHVNGQRARAFFEHSGFTVDNTDKASFWKWIVERQTVIKLSKALTRDNTFKGHMGASYINSGMDHTEDD